jgi:replicative DNA helicase
MSGVGKSHVLTHLGAEAMKRGFNVLHYTFELNEGAIAIRYDSNLLGVDSSNCFEFKEDIKKMYEENKDVFGRLMIKYYPNNQANVNILRGHVEKLKADGFFPDLILVDYAGIMRSTEKSDLLRIELKKITEELRAFAGEVGVPLWTALQANKEAAGNDIVDMTNMAESFAQAAAADFILGLARKSEQKSTGIGTLFIAKNRAGKDGLKFNIHLDTAQSRLRLLNASEAQSSGYVPKAGKEAWKRIQDSLKEDSLKLENI